MDASTTSSTGRRPWDARSPGLYFLRFWRESFDRLFLLFAFAFWLLAANYALLGTIQFANEARVYVFTVRLVAFCLILYGIFDKNRRR